MAALPLLVRALLGVLSSIGLTRLLSGIGLTLFTVGAVQSGLPQELGRTATNVARLAGTTADETEKLVGHGNLLLVGLGVLAVVLVVNEL